MTTTTSRNAGKAGLHVRYEKAGLLFDILPIPWNADAVIVEANVRLPPSVRCDKQQFILRLSTGGPDIGAEWLRQDGKHAPVRVLFRLPIPGQTCTAKVFWREYELGHAELPVIALAEFTQALTLQLPSLHVQVGTHTVACETFVNTQCQSLCAAALVCGAGPLAPVADLYLHLEVRRADGECVAEVPVDFTSGQLRSRQALLTLVLPKLRRIGEYTVSWFLGPRHLHTHKLRAISKKRLLSSLRISATRFVVLKHSGEVSALRSLPQREGQLHLEGIARVSPCFFVCSSQAGMAGVVHCTVQAVMAGDTTAPPAVDHEMLVTDGPMPLLACSLPAAELARVKHFTLATSAGRLGILPVMPSLTADFTGEGGFAPLDDFLWSPAADEQLNERLDKLLDGE